MYDRMIHTVAQTKRQTPKERKSISIPTPPADVVPANVGLYIRCLHCGEMITIPDGYAFEYITYTCPFCDGRFTLGIEEEGLQVYAR